MQRIASCSTGELTNRWTGATGSECRIKRDPAKVLGGAVARSTQTFGAYLMTNVPRLLLLSGLVMLLLACSSRSDVSHVVAPAPTPTPKIDDTVRAWPNAPYDQISDNEPLKRAWQNFERTEKYRLAQPPDRNLTPSAAERVRTNSANQIIPVISWWGATGYRSANGKDFLTAIVVDPSRSDPTRYGLAVIAAVASEGAGYKTYWVLRDEDMESYLLSPASGSMFIECFHRDGTEQTKELVWDRKSRGFRLK